MQNWEFDEERGLYHNSAVGEDDEGLQMKRDCSSDAKRTPVSKAASFMSVKASEAGKKKKKSKLLYYLETKYEVVRDVCGSMKGWKRCESDQEDFDFIWTDCVMAADRFSQLKPYQKYNHFVGMSALSRKNNLGRNLLRMKKHFPEEYRFFPDTWILPTDLADFKQQFTSKKNRTFIVKPDNQCQGRGIFLTRDFDKIPIDFNQGLVAQRYIHKPFLLDGYKFDMRIYVLVTGSDPLRIFLHEEGLVRLCTTPYVPPVGSNLAQPTMHLTNYAVNVRNPLFEENTNPQDIHSGHKRSLKALYDHLAEKGYDVLCLQSQIEDLIIKTLITVQPSLAHVQRSCQGEDIENSMCFELLGLDVILDGKLRPWLLEVNHAPSFGTDSELDQLVKFKVISDSLKIAHINTEARKRFEQMRKELKVVRLRKKEGAKDKLSRSQLVQQAAISRSNWEDSADLGGFKKLYPTENSENHYMRFHDKAVEIWETLTGGNGRKPLRVTIPVIAEQSEPSEPALQAPKRAIMPRNQTISHKVPKPMKPLSIPTKSPLDSFKLSNNQPIASFPPLLVRSSSETTEEQRARRTRNVSEGETIRVQTNAGWEKVLVLRKDEKGRLDIRFEDGELMTKVIPKVEKIEVNINIPYKSYGGLSQSRGGNSLKHT